jgi:Fusaric acid resistance protein-like
MSEKQWGFSALRKALRAAAPGMAGTLASFLLTYALCVRFGTNNSPAILSVVLSIGLTRSLQQNGFHLLLRRIVTIPVIALGGAIVGALFLHAPAVAAIIFVLGMGASVALRRYGRSASAIGGVIALTLMAMLIVPAPIDRSAGIPVTIALVIAAAIIAQLCAWGAAYVARVAGWTTSVEPVRSTPKRDSAAPAGSWSATDRMALQMIVALSLAFAIGMTVFRMHWPWVVLSAFIVTSGAVGRGDALYKALLRIGGAIVGTFVAELLRFVHIGNSVEYAIVMFVVLFLGMWLRPINYAYWAASTTLLFGLILDPQSGTSFSVFGIRVICIVVGAACGVLATWFVVPIRSSQVVRRRLADAMGDMRDVLSGEARDLHHHTEQLERIAPAWRLHRATLGQRDTGAHPATWIERAHALLAHMRGEDFDRRKAGADLKRLRNDVFGERRE